MLAELIVHNFAIIRDLQVDFEPGLNVLTGETGAGKSILVGAVNLILGSRASQEMIRSGAEEATVEALFVFHDSPVLQERYRSLGLAPGEECVIRRVVSRTGRNRVFIDGQLVTLQQLQAFAEGLLSISGQHEHQLLLNPEVHLDLLDDFGKLGPHVTDVAEAFDRWTRTRDQWMRLRRHREELARQRDFLRFQLNELESASLKPAEDEKLQAEEKVLRHAETLYEAAKRAQRLLYSDQGAVLERLDQVGKDLAVLASIDPRQKTLAEHLDQATIHLEELHHALQEYAGSIAFDPHRLAEIQDRLALIQRLAKKYGPTVDHMLEKLEELRTALADEEEQEFREEALQKEMETLRSTYLSRARALSEERRRAASALSEAVRSVLASLDLPRARFDVRFDEERENLETVTDAAFTRKGVDRVEFLLSANPGEDLKPLARVASGGELSRILLALKSLLSLQGEAETLIFDEVDTGIGGRTAELVGRQLQQLARRHQVICITHLPQIACYGAHHYKVAKHTSGDETHTLITRLDGGERVEELARMLGGVSISEKTRAHAREWLEKAQRATCGEASS
ncbi:DNA repair protein RecN [Desulfoglaeba alkanexedens]|uniref:DNA repair protein RecN n=1 Tax=Desulfoglaeba alkanexedens TaxID=361111 RepID=UPI00147736C6|nr:DNA repair protein RecN [Desulfoglaeba alkanexedens]